MQRSKYSHEYFIHYLYFVQESCTPGVDRGGVTELSVCQVQT